MKSIYLLLMFAVMSIIALPTVAMQTSDFTNFSHFAPADAVFYASIQTDRNFILGVDDLLDELADLAFIDDTSMRDLLTMMLTGDEDFSGNFDELITPWLGDHLAVILTPIDLDYAEYHLYFVLDVRNEFNAIDFLDLALEDKINDGFLERVDGEDDVRYLPIVSFGQTAYMVRDRTLFIGVSSTLDTLAQPDDVNLTDDATFNAVLSGLPDNDYNALVYFNPSLAPESLLDATGITATNPDLADTLTTLFNLQLGAGLTLDDAQNVSLDITMIPNDALEALPTLLDESEAVDISTFMALIPLNMPLALIGNGQGANIDGTFLETNYDDDLFTLQMQFSINESTDDE